MWKLKHVLMDQAGDGTGTGAGGAGAGDAAAAAAAAKGGDKGAAGDDKSLLSQAGAAGDDKSKAAAAAAAAAAADPLSWLPEKYRVKTADGKTVDVEASAKKVAEGHAALEKRMGETGAPPEKPEGYKADGVLAKLKEANKGVEVQVPAELIKDFNTWAHDAKLTQGQYDKALVAYLGGMQQLVDTAFDNAKASATTELVKVWGADGMKPDSAQMQRAYKAFMTYAPAAMRTPAEMDKVGNNAIVLQILEAVGREMGEDTKIHGDGAAGDDIHAMMRTEAYWNKKHPEHQATVRKVNEFFARGGKATPKAA